MKTRSLCYLVIFIILLGLGVSSRRLPAPAFEGEPPGAKASTRPSRDSFDPKATDRVERAATAASMGQEALALVRSDLPKAVALLHEMIAAGLGPGTENEFFPPPGMDDPEELHPGGPLVRQLMTAAPAATLDGIMADASDRSWHYAAARNLAAVWMEGDSKAFSAWLSAQGRSEIRDSLAADFANQIGYAGQPREALEWLASVESVPWQDRWMPGILEHWRDQNPTSFESYLEAANHPAAVKVQIERLR